jgi:hypothetical protein
MIDAREFDRVINEAMRDEYSEHGVEHEKSVGKDVNPLVVQPSDLGKCEREVYCNHVLPSTQYAKLEDIGRLVSGQAVHDYYQRILKKKFVKLGHKMVEAERHIRITIDSRAKPPIVIHGRADMVLKFPEEKTLVEIKTFEWPIERMVAPIESGEKRHPFRFRAQVTPYLARERCIRGIFTYVYRGNLTRHRSFDYDLNLKFMAYLKTRAREEYYQKKNRVGILAVPPEGKIVPVFINANVCGICPWKVQCAEHMDGWTLPTALEMMNGVKRPLRVTS